MLRAYKTNALQGFSLAENIKVVLTSETQKRDVKFFKKFSAASRHYLHTVCKSELKGFVSEFFAKHSLKNQPPGGPKILLIPDDRTIRVKTLLDLFQIFSLQ